MAELVTFAQHVGDKRDTFDTKSQRNEKARELSEKR
jgi:hypothetical protein